MLVYVARFVHAQSICFCGTCLSALLLLCRRPTSAVSPDPSTGKCPITLMRNAQGLCVSSPPFVFSAAVTLSPAAGTLMPDRLPVL